MTISFRTLGSSLNMSLSRVQTIIALMAGILSISGALAAFFRSAPHTGELVVTLEDAKTQQTVSDATVEVLTMQDTLVTTLRHTLSGKAYCTLEEGHYRMRVQHPRYGPIIRDVQVSSGHTTEVLVQLRGATSLGNTVRHLFHH